MEIEVYAICYNEELMLPYFLRYYSQFANIIIYDNYSTDNSESIALSAGAKVIKYDSGNKIDDLIYLDIKNNCWKSSKADWVIVCDVDEFIYHPDLINILKNTDSSIILPTGYNMYSEKFPTTDGQIYEEVTLGIPSVLLNKMCIFKPSQITDINFKPGCHTANPEGNVEIDTTSDIKLLHMKCLSKEYIINRHALFGKRLSKNNKKNQWGKHYLVSSKKIGKNFDDGLKNALKVV